MGTGPGTAPTQQPRAPDTEPFLSGQSGRVAGGGAGTCRQAFSKLPAVPRDQKPLLLRGLGPLAWWTISPSPSRRGRRTGPRLGWLPAPHPGWQHGGRGTRAGAGPAGRGWRCPGSPCIWGRGGGTPAPVEVPGAACVRGEVAGPPPDWRCAGPHASGEGPLTRARRG